MKKINHIPEQIELASTPSTPSSGYVKLYRKTDGNWYYLDDVGVENPFGGGGTPAIDFGFNQAVLVSTNNSNFASANGSNIYMSAGTNLLNNILSSQTSFASVILATTGVSNTTVTYDSSVMIGRNIMFGSNNTGLQNSVLMGANALSSYNGTGTLTGAVVIGSLAGQDSFNANRAVYIGESAGQFAGSNNNIHIGYFSGRGARGVQNTTIGESTFSASTNKNGIQNTLVGAFSGQNIAAGSSATGVGVQTMQTAVSPTGCTAIGRWALRTMNSGVFNTAIGFRAGEDSGTFSDCMFLGAGANFNTFDNRREDNVAVLGGQTYPLGKFIYGSSYESGSPQGNITFRPSYRAPSVNGDGTDMTFEAGEVTNAANNAGSFVFRVGDPANLTGGFSPYINALRISGDNATAGHLQAFNGATCDGATWIDASDRELKTDIVEETRGLEVVQKLESKKFKYKHDMLAGDRLGFIAQDIKDYIPEIVNEKGQSYLGVHYQGIIPILVNAIKELKAEIDELKKDRG